ncbi:MAG: murein biosynthesis integral membrane protein MurJ [Anaerolineaceae bacterium]|nr:murein biosynthesis integral membrane protein MurJ [Anaerolineaceae bacterium]
MADTAASQDNSTLSNAQILRAALLMLLGFLASGVLGFVRTAVLNAQFGTSEAHEAFLAAQRLPELIFVLVAGGALGSSFIPIYARVREGDKQAAWHFASTVMTFSALAAGLLGLIVILFADPIVQHVLYPGRPLVQQQLAAHLMRLMMVTPFIFSISGLVMGILQSNGLFLLPSLAISMNSLGIIAGALFIAPMMASANAAFGLLPMGGHLPLDQVGNASVYGLAYGAILSAVLHLLVQLPGLWQLRAKLRPSFDWKLPGVWDVLRLMGPRILGQGVVQINFVVNVNLASGMIEGSYVALQTAFNLMFFALGMIGQSVGSAVFPTLSALHARGDWDGYKDRLSRAMRSVLFLALPATAAFIVLGVPIVSIFERGEWSRTATEATAWALGFYASGIAGFALLEILSRAFYALEDTWTPVRIGIGAMVANIVLSVLFIRVIGDPESLIRGPFAGLALANALTTLIEAATLYWLLRRRIGHLGTTSGLDDAGTWYSVSRTAIATLIMAVVLWVINQVMPTEGFVVAIVGGIIGGGVFFVAAWVLGVPEVLDLLGPVLRRIPVLRRLTA